MTVTRGTTNGNKRGNTTARRQRREWLVWTYRANQDVVHIWDVARGADPDGPPTWVASSSNGGGMVRLQESWGRVAVAIPACRCYRCGCLLTADTLTVDRIFPGVLGGLYRTVRRDKAERVTNIRPACGPCNEKTGGALARRKVK